MTTSEISTLADAVVRDGGVQLRIGERIADLADTDRITLARWWWRGQPDPDIISGTFEVPRDLVGDVVGKLLDTESPLELKVFPKGIPWPEDVLVSFRTGIG